MQDADRAHILRQQWRAGLHRLNGDEDGALLKEQEADLLERYHAARDKALAVKETQGDDAYNESAERIVYDKLREDVRQLRVRVRTARGANPQAGAFSLDVMHDFAEPSDEELLAGSAS